MDKTGRNGLRIGDTIRPDFLDRYNQLKEKHKSVLKQYTYEANIEQHEKVWFDGIEIIKQFEIIDSEYEINELYSKGKTILAEGAQGTLLDVDFGSYPFVTSSNTICAGACTGMGIAPSTIGNVMGIVKAYCTRVGSGPFPTELNDEVGQNLRDIGREYGSTTGRPRRCGWLDLVALRYAVMLNGVTEIILTKADVLDTFETIKVATAYKVNGNETQRVPFDIDVPIEPIYTELKGWNTSIEQMRNSNQLPKELNDYIAFIEKEVGVPVSIVSVGPDREATIFRKKQ
jgi:adenylosuccinate synthase